MAGPAIHASSPHNATDGGDAAIQAMDHKVQWLHTYVIGDGTYCVYIAPDQEAILEHARLSGFPVTRIEEVKTIIDPTTGE